METHEINGTVNADTIGDMTTFAANFGSKRTSQSTSFIASDSWKYQVCTLPSASGCQPLFYGTIIAEQKRPGKDYEYTVPLGCSI